MAREKPPEPPAEDIPAWFMTYSDVITLLMTFFILLLTFSTTEPDRFERIQKTIFAGGKGSGVIGAPIEGPENESFIQRVRPRAARMAMNGAEMPPYEHDPSTKSVGEGLKGLTDEEAKQDTMSTSQIDLEINKLIDAENHLTPKGAQLAAMMAKPLAKMPIHLSIQCSSEQNFEKATAFVIHLYQTEQIRPGHVGVSIVDDVNSSDLRFSIERYEN